MPVPKYSIFYTIIKNSLFNIYPTNRKIHFNKKKNSLCLFQYNINCGIKLICGQLTKIFTLVLKLQNKLKMAKMLPRLRSVQLIIIGLFGLIFLASFTESHVIQKRHDIIESSASIDNVKIPNTNDSSTLENEAPIPNEGEFDYGSSGKDVINNDENNNVNSVQDTKVTSTTDVNNGIEQNFDSHTNHTTNVTQTINSQTNFTKDVSQDDSVENR